MKESFKESVRFAVYDDFIDNDTEFVVDESAHDNIWENVYDRVGDMIENVVDGIFTEVNI